MRQRVLPPMTGPTRAVVAVGGLLSFLAALVPVVPAGASAVPGSPGQVHAAAISPGPGQTGHIDEFRPRGISQTATTDPLGITSGPDGNLWFTDSGASRINQINTSGTGLHEFPTNTPGATPVAIVTGPDNRLWFPENSSSVDSIGRFDPQAKTGNEFAIGTPNSIPTDVTAGPDGNLWFTEYGNGHVGTIHPDGTGERDFALTGAGPTSTVVFPQAIVAGPDGNLWFTEQGVGKVGRMSTAGVLLGEFPPTGGLREVDGITSGPDGNLWFTEKAGNKIGVMSTAGALLHEYPAAGNPTAIVSGPDGNLWYIEQTGNNVARIMPSGVITEYAVPTAGAFSPHVQPTGLTVGPDRNIWFTEQDTKAAVARLTVVAALGFTPSSVDFGTQVAGTTSPPTSLTLRNNDILTFTNSTSVTGTNSSDFVVGANGCSTIVIGGTCSVSVTFRPTGPGVRTATLSVSNSAQGSPFQAPLTGIGLAPGAVSLTPVSLNFGNQAVGTTKTVAFALTNDSPQVVGVTADAISGPNPADFSISNDGCTGTPVPPGANCTLSVAFHPQATGTSTAMLSVTDTASTSPQTSALSGNGTGPTQGPPPSTVTLNPAAFGFGNQAVGVTGAAAGFTLTNNTSIIVAVSTTAVTGPNASDFPVSNDTCAGQIVGPGAGCTVSVSFAPKAAGTSSATLSIAFDGSGSPQTSALSGTGVAPAAGGGGSGGGASSAGAGYWEVATDGGIFSFGSAMFHGSTGSIRLNKPIVGMAPTPDRQGYWLVATDGGIFNFGDAGFFGSAGSLSLNKPIVGMAATPSGGGYWLVASDGGIFTYGDAAFFGSTGAIALNKPIVGMASTPSGRGYWLVATDGGIFNYGDAGFFGSAGAIALNKPIVAMASTPGGAGYYLAASDGGIFTYGDAVFHGSTGAIALNKPIVSMAPSPDGAGYWLSATDGGIFNFGSAGFFGSTGSLRLNQPVVSMASS